MTDQEIIRALRCSSSVGSECRHEKCPFFAQEEIPEELREKCGRDTWGSCDVDSIALAAADRLEQLAKPERTAVSLDGKCGGCRFAVPATLGRSDCYVECTNRPQNRPNGSALAHIKQRSAPACKRYEGKEVPTDGQSGTC